MNFLTIFNFSRVIYVCFCLSVWQLQYSPHPAFIELKIITGFLIQFYSLRYYVGPEVDIWLVFLSMNEILIFHSIPFVMVFGVVFFYFLFVLGMS